MYTDNPDGDCTVNEGSMFSTTEEDQQEISCKASTEYNTSSRMGTDARTAVNHLFAFGCFMIPLSTVLICIPANMGTSSMNSSVSFQPDEMNRSIA